MAAPVPQRSTSIDITNLANCTEEARRAVLATDQGPPEPDNFESLRSRLAVSRDQLPPLYRNDFADPFLQAMDTLGRAGFDRLLRGDPTRERSALLLLDMAQAVLQQGEDFQARATDAFQEVVADLYDGFLSEEDRGTALPDFETTPPLVKWGNPDFGPYTWPVTATRNFGAKAAVVSLPPANARAGLLAWSALSHETAGHDILGANRGLEQEVEQAVFQALSGSALQTYWTRAVSEAAADVLGILNMGPAAGIGLIGYFRGIQAAAGRGAILRNAGTTGDAHPADVLRGFLAASTVRLLSFTAASQWASLIEKQTGDDVFSIRIDGRRVSEADAKSTAKIVAETIATHPLGALRGRTFLSIQNWRDTDENTALEVARSLTSTTPLPDGVRHGFFAAHVVAAATYAGLRKDAPLPSIFDRMLAVLQHMHSVNPSWGPLLVRHPGNIHRHLHHGHGRSESVWSCGTANQIALDEAGASATLNTTLFDAGFQSKAQRENYVSACAKRARSEHGQCVGPLPSAASTKVFEVGDAMCDTGVPCS